MDWLNENSLRAYPFVDGSAMDEYPAAIVDATFGLGQDIPFDFDEESAEIRLTTVITSGSNRVLAFQYYIRGTTPLGVPLIFTVPVGAPKHTIHRASTNLSHGYITLGDLSELPDGNYNSPVEARTITPILGAADIQVSVYNIEKQRSMVPYDTDAPPGLTPAQRYTRAKALMPTWSPNVCLDAPVGLLTGVIGVRGGFNVSVSPNLSTNSIDILYAPNGSSEVSSIVGYVTCKLATDDPLADLDGDGVVRESDVNLAKYILEVIPPELSIQGVLKTINGVKATRGNITLEPGPGITVTADPERNTVLLSLQPLSLPQKCL